MALVLSDGFDSYSAGATVGPLPAGDPGWLAGNATATIVAAGGRFGGNCYRQAGSNGAASQIAAVGPNPGFAFWMKIAAFSNPVVLVRASTFALLTLGTDRSLVVRDGAGTTRATSAPGVVPADEWVWVEVSFPAGSCAAYVNGVPVASFTGARTEPVLTTTNVFVAVTSMPNLDVDDFIHWNDSGSFFNTFGLAPRRIQLLQTDANGTPVQWTPASGTNWAAVKSADWAGGVGVTAAASGLKDRYSFADLTATPGSVDAVTIKTQVQNTGGDPATLAHVSAVGATEVSTTPQTVPLTRAVLKSHLYRDPNGVAWTASTVNSAEFGQTLGI